MDAPAQMLYNGTVPHMISRRRLPRIHLFLLSLLLCRIAQAAPESPNSDTHLNRARQFFEEQKYSQAAGELREAYRITPNPIFLFNAGQSYRKAEDKANALKMYQLFLEKAPDSKLAAEARGYVIELESALVLQARLSTIKLELEAERAETDEAQRLAEKERLRAEQAQKALEKERHKPWYRRPWFYGLVGSAVGVVVVSAIITTLVVVNDPRHNVDSGNLQVKF